MSLAARERPGGAAGNHRQDLEYGLHGRLVHVRRLRVGGEVRYQGSDRRVVGGEERADRVGSRRGIVDQVVQVAVGGNQLPGERREALGEGLKVAGCGLEGVQVGVSVVR